MSCVEEEDYQVQADVFQHEHSCRRKQDGENHEHLKIMKNIFFVKFWEFIEHIGHPFKQHLGGGSTCSHSSSSTRADPNILKNSWRLGSDQDGGSGGHLLGQGSVQVREKATGDLLVFVFFVKTIPLQLSPLL